MKIATQRQHGQTTLKRALRTSLVLCMLVVFLFGVAAPAVTEAVSAEQQRVWQLGLGAVDVDTGSCGGGASSATLDGSLPEKTIQMLDAAGIKTKLAALKDLYKYVENETGVSWLVLAAIHYREASMDPSRSMWNGQPLGDYKNSDGVMLSSDAKTDSVNAANHFKKMAKSVYGIDITNATTAETLGQAFLAYNRGSMYKEWGKTWQESPYVMNYFDDSHMAMKWIDADSYVKPGGRKVNSISGTTNAQLGALTIYKYLSDSSDVKSIGATTSSGTCDSSSQNGSATILGDTAFPLFTNKSLMNKHNKGLFKNGTTGRAGHPYIAYDILTPANTKVAAFMGGTVLSVSGGNRCKSPGTTIEIYNPENKLTITYIHVFKTTYIQKGDSVKAGQLIAEVGTAVYGCGVEHLHIDANTTKGRPVCSRLSCPQKSVFEDIGPQLYKAYMALPT